ncbi:MAG: hypothetical protein K0S19_1750, partial [Geminicoccaceae bacterium]|nr:hypothetical protein [Geminicoccaceae bacterium]
ETELHQDVSQPVLGVLLLRESLRELLSRYEAFAKQYFTEPIATGRCGRHGVRGIRKEGFRDIIGSPGR